MIQTATDHVRTATVRIRGRDRALRCTVVDGHEVVVTGRIVRIAAVRDEWYQDLGDLDAFATTLRGAKLRADIGTFVARPPASAPPGVRTEADNCAAIELHGYEHWWQRQIGSKTRALVRKAERAGVGARIVPYDEALVRAIKAIYDECPVRQGKPFWHYRKSLEELHRLHATYLERSDFIGAYLGDDLVGFVKLVHAGATANTMHIIATLAHRDKAVSNVLVAKAVEVACARGAQLLVYDKFEYDTGGSDTLLQFKRHNGFARVDYPRCFVPLSGRGRLALRLGLHRPLAARLPKRFARALVGLRGRWYELRNAVAKGRARDPGDGPRGPAR